jgi:PAS domain S-box-containing protein
VNLDINDAKNAGDQLRRSEAYLAEAQKLSHTAASAYNAATILYWSEETYRLFGFAPHEGVPSREAVWQRIHPEDRNRVRAEVDDAQNGKAGSTSEFRIVLPDGTLKYVKTIRQPVFSTGGKVVEVVATQIDLTERKRAEQALRESELKLREIIETVPGFLWSTDATGEPTHINQRILDYSGLRLEDFKLGGWEKLLHPNDFAETARTFYHAIQTGTSWEAIHRLRRADGEFRWYQARGEPLRDQQGRVVQWYGLSVDIDERKRAENELRATQAQLARASQAATVAELSASIAHEINQPLAGIVASAKPAGPGCQATTLISRGRGRR